MNKCAAAIVLASLVWATSAGAQFYAGKTLTLLTNYGVGGNIDAEARVAARHLSRHIAGNPTIVVQNAPGAGGLLAINLLGLGIRSRADGLTVGFFTISATAPLTDDPALKISLADDEVVRRVLQQMRTVRPEVRKVLKDSIGG
jgi:tripartite-type tricarboxylate transporter receptor subunit TctC